MKRRNTKQRQIVLQALQKHRDHPTAEQIYRDVSVLDSKISLGTVYRNLAILRKENQIGSIHLSDADHFDPNTNGHNHFFCEVCEKILDIDIEYDTEKDGIKTDLGYYVSSHQTVYKGICPECLQRIEGERMNE